MFLDAFCFIVLLNSPLLNFGRLESVHNINTPSKPEGAAGAREARESGELKTKCCRHLTMLSPFSLVNVLCAIGQGGEANQCMSWQAILVARYLI